MGTTFTAMKKIIRSHPVISFDLLTVLIMAIIFIGSYFNYRTIGGTLAILLYVAYCWIFLHGQKEKTPDYRIQIEALNGEWKESITKLIQAMRETVAYADQKNRTVTDMIPYNTMDSFGDMYAPDCFKIPKERPIYFGIDFATGKDSTAYTIVKKENKQWILLDHSSSWCSDFIDAWHYRNLATDRMRIKHSTRAGEKNSSMIRSYVIEAEKLLSKLNTDFLVRMEYDKARIAAIYGIPSHILNLEKYKQPMKKTLLQWIADMTPDHQKMALAALNRLAIDSDSLLSMLNNPVHDTQIYAINLAINCSKSERLQPSRIPFSAVGALNKLPVITRNNLEVKLDTYLKSLAGDVIGFRGSVHGMELSWDMHGNCEHYVYSGTNKTKLMNEYDLFMKPKEKKIIKKTGWINLIEVGGSRRVGTSVFSSAEFARASIIGGGGTVRTIRIEWEETE